MTFLLAGDIGRITTLRFVDTEGEYNIDDRRYRSTDYESLLQLVEEFLRYVQLQSGRRLLPEKACFAVPCPVKNNTANLSETRFLNWQLNNESLNNVPLKLINDFEAVGYGVVALEDSDLRTLQEGNPNRGNDQERNQIAVIGAGSGLGEAFVIKQENAPPIVCASEGGHADYAPYSQPEIALWEFLHNEDRLHVDMEMVISGKGIVEIYRFWRDKHQLTEESPDIAKVVRTWEQETQRGVKSLDPAAEIAKAALFNRSSLCKRTMRTFIKAYGAEAGNLALKLKPYGGLYVAGSIAPKILPLFYEVGFCDAFNQKGPKVKNLLPDIPVRVVLNPQVGLKGAEFYARNMS